MFKEDRPVRVLTSGTLGDALLCLCRMYRIHEMYGVTFDVTRLTRDEYAYFNEPIADLYSMSPIINFEGYRSDLIHEFENNDGKTPEGREIRRGLMRFGYDICPMDAATIRMQFPDYDVPKCFPKLEIPEIEIDDNAVVIQVQGGKYKAIHGDMRGFSSTSIGSMCEYLIDKGHSVYLIGVAHPMLVERQKLEEMSEELGVHNWVGKTKNDFGRVISLIAGCKYMIGFDGFPTFFAASQRKWTIQFSHLKYNPRIDYECICWKEYTTLIRPIPTCGRLNVPFYLFDAAYKQIDVSKVF